MHHLVEERLVYDPPALRPVGVLRQLRHGDVKVGQSQLRVCVTRADREARDVGDGYVAPTIRRSQ